MSSPVSEAEKSVRNTATQSKGGFWIFVVLALVVGSMITFFIMGASRGANGTVAWASIFPTVTSPTDFGNLLPYIGIALIVILTILLVSYRPAQNRRSSNRRKR